jgi:putrescine aminotransferase
MTAHEPAAADWRTIDARHHLHPFTDTRRLNAEGVRVITRGEGVWLWDADGNRLLDGMAGLWCVQLGYGRPELAEAAYRQMRELPYYNTFFKTATPPAIELARVLADLTPAGLNHLFFAGSGSEVLDSVARLVRHYWNLMGKPAKKTIIGRELGYHGSTMAAASLGGMANMHAQADLPLPGFVHIEPPYWYGRGGDLDPASFGRKAAQALEAKIRQLGPETVAAFVGEPVMGAGGVIVPPETYWPEIQRICRAHDVLLVADEVICGFGRTGHWWGCERFAISPDIMPMAKGITSGYVPLAALAVGDRVAEVLVEAGGEFAHGFTYSGHPVSCAVALENIRILKEEGLVDRVRDDVGPYLRRCLEQALADHPLVGEVRGVGLLAAIELVADKAGRRFFDPLGEVGSICRDRAFANGLVMRAVRDTMVLSPALVITRAEIDELVERVRKSIDATAQALPGRR